MPRKVRQLIADLERAGFVNRGGKGSHRNFTHSREVRVTLSGSARDDAKHYQERDVRRALNDWQVFSSAQGIGFNPVINAAWEEALICQDPPVHTARRKLMMAELGPAALKPVADTIEQRASALAERIAEMGTFDAVTDFALDLPVGVVMDLIGWPHDVRPRLLDLAAGSWNAAGPANARMEQGLTTMTNEPAYTDDFGSWISTYSPILDEDGQSVGAIGVDYPLTYVTSVQADVQKQLYPVLGISYVVLLALVLVLSTSLTRPLKRLTAATERIAAGEYDLDVQALVRTRFPDEMYTLAESVSTMAAKVGARERSLTREVQRLKVEIDAVKREEAVKEITESDFFSDLTSKAADMRRSFRSNADLDGDGI